MTFADARQDLARMGGQGDDAIDLAEAALALAALDRPRRDRQRYRSLLAEMTAHLADRTAAVATAEGRAEALAAVLGGSYRLIGDDDDDDPDYANLMQLLDQRRGPAPTLGLVWLHMGRRQSWPMEALAFPGALLLRLMGEDGRRVILDPFAGGQVLDAAGLRALLKVSAGAGAELEPGHYARLSNRALLVRLQAAIKLRHLRHAELARAAAVLEATLLFAPDEVAMWREVGLIHLRQGEVKKAIAALETFLARAPNSTARHRTSALLQELRKKPT